MPRITVGGPLNPVVEYEVVAPINLNERLQECVQLFDSYEEGIRFVERNPRYELFIMEDKSYALPFNL